MDDTLYRDLHRVERNADDHPYGPVRELAARARAELIAYDRAEYEVRDLFAEHWPAAYVADTPVLDLVRALFDLNTSLREHLEGARGELEQYEEESE